MAERGGTEWEGDKRSWRESRREMRERAGRRKVG